MLSYAIIVAFLIYALVGGLYLSWISRARSFQGIPEVSYSWVTMSMPVGAVLLLITAFLKIRDEIKGRTAQSEASAVVDMLLVTAAFILFLVIGMPVAFAIGISGALFFLQHPSFRHHSDPAHVSQTQNFALLAVPLFILAGNFMNKSGITEQLLRLATVLTGRLNGGLAQVSIALAALMGGVSARALRTPRCRRACSARHAQARFLERLCGRRPVVRFAADADHSARHRLHPLRHRRTGLDRPTVRRGLRPGLSAVGRARGHDRR